MTLHRCPHCNQYYNVMPGITDFVHQCFGSNTLSQDDILHLSGPGWNLRGVVNDASPGARVEGVKEGNITPRGNNADTMRQLPHEEYIEL